MRDQNSRSICELRSSASTISKVDISWCELRSVPPTAKAHPGLEQSQTQSFERQDDRLADAIMALGESQRQANERLGTGARMQTHLVSRCNQRGQDGNANLDGGKRQ